MKTLLFYDCETNGLDPSTNQIVEVAFCLWSIPHRSAILNYSTVVQAPSNECADINGIPEDLLPLGISQETLPAVLGAHFNMADAIVAHNADFDASFVPLEIREMKPWVCSCNDIEWGVSGSKALIALCLAMGLGVSHAHRAMADVSMLERLFSRACEKGFPLEAALQRAMGPKARFVAKVSYEDREKAKALRFHWDGERKQWWRKMLVSQAEEVRQSAGFLIVEQE